MSTIAAMADSLVTALRAAGFAEAERKPLPYVLREDCATRKCVVICRQAARDDGDRGDFEQAFELTIILQKAVANPHSNAEVDQLLDDLQTLWALWDQSGALRNAELQGARWIGGPSHPTSTMYEYQQLLELNLFTSVTLVKYQIDT